MISFKVTAALLALWSSHGVGALNAFQELEELAANNAEPPHFMDAHDHTLGGVTLVEQENGEQTFRVWPIFYDALDYSGNKTKVFAWLSLPCTKDEQGSCSVSYDGAQPDKVPAVVLLHGGGGTSFKKWMGHWAYRGYAAIAIAHEGQTDVALEDKSLATAPLQMFERHEWAGPAMSHASYGDITLPYRDQWIYHAVADSILANSLMRSFSSIDSTNIGIVGISWGAVAAATTIGYDKRFSFMVAAFGCGSMSQALTNLGKSIRTESDPELYDKVWDPKKRLKDVTIPTYWISSPYDFYFPLTQITQTTSALTKSPYMTSFIMDLKHNHDDIWLRPEVYVFADSVRVSGGDVATSVWTKQVHKSYSKFNGHVSYQVIFDSSKLLRTAEFIFSEEDPFTIPTYQRTWKTIPAKVDKLDCDKAAESRCHWRVASQVPQGAKAWFFNVRSEGKLIASSDYVEITLIDDKTKSLW